MSNLTFENSLKQIFKETYNYDLSKKEINIIMSKISHSLLTEINEWGFNDTLCKDKLTDEICKILNLPKLKTYGEINA